MYQNPKVKSLNKKKSVNGRYGMQNGMNFKMN